MEMLLPDVCRSRWHAPGLLDDTLAGPPFRKYVMLTATPHLLANLHLAPKEILCGSYHWIVRRAALVQARDGPHTGLKQYALEILKCSQPECSPDWWLREAIDKVARQGMAEELARHNR